MTKEKIAQEFSRRLKDCLTEGQLKKVIELNRLRKGTPDQGCCATHDVCDPNMTMLAAFERVMERRPEFMDDSEIETHDYDLWNGAWELAKREEFFYSEDKPLIAHSKTDLLRIVNDQPLQWELYGENSIEDAVDLIKADPEFKYGRDFRRIFDRVLDELLETKV